MSLAPVGVLPAQARPATRPASRPVAPAPSARSAAIAMARAGDAVVTVVAYRDGSSDVSSGTGVRLADGRVLASLRQLRGASRVEVFGVDGDLLGTVTTLEQAEARFDLAVMSRITAPGDGIALARRSATVAQKVSVLGARKGTSRAVLDRSVASVEPDASGRPLLRIGGTIAGSAVGSPVVNVRSELVGIALGTVAGRDGGDFVIDVSAVRELLARPAVRLALPGRDGSIAVATAADAKVPVPGGDSGNAAAKVRIAGIFPERYGRPIDADTVKGWALDLYGCARIEVRRKVYCYLRITNLARGATFAVSGADLADSTRRKTRGAENLIVGESVQRVAGWRRKAEVTLKELESARVALEFTAPGLDAHAVHLVVDVAGERQVWFGPFTLQRAP